MPVSASRPQPKLEWFKSNPRAPVRLFCFHYAGGGSTAFYSWQDQLPQVEVCAIDLPGRGALVLAPPLTRIEPLVEALAAVLLPILPEKPFAFFGHSMGAVVSFELTRYLRRQGAPTPELLIVSGRQAPNIAPQTAFYQLDDGALIERLLHLNGTSKEVLQHPELAQLILPVIRADFEVCETYKYVLEQPLACPIHAYGGTEDPDVFLHHLEAWRQETAGECTVRLFDGDHFYLRTAETLLLESIAEALEPIVKRAECVV